jgi:hypothetical protein
MPPFIKIGTSTSFERRMREFYVQPRDVLAIEPGGRPLEASRHQQFASYRKRGTELFKPNAVLAELINQLSEKYPDPWMSAKNINHPDAYSEMATDEVIRGRRILGIA